MFLAFFIFVINNKNLMVFSFDVIYHSSSNSKIFYLAFIVNKRATFLLFETMELFWVSRGNNGS